MGDGQPLSARRSRSSDLLETVNLSGDEVWFNTRKIRLRRRLPSTKRRLGPAGSKQRKKEKFAGEWARQTDGAAICSYPPEDMVIEDYGRFLKKKGKSMLSEERAALSLSPPHSWTVSICARPSATGTKARST